MNKKVVLGLSGGVDSTVAALMLQEKGYEVTGLYFDVKGNEADRNSINTYEGRGRAEVAAGQLGIALIYKDVSKAFEDIVINNFCSEYMKGRTPNPCVICNPEVKFKVLAETADETGADFIATGHYAGTVKDEVSGLWHIRRAANEKKDQSYMLYRLGQDIISRLILPLNSLSDKEQVRNLARSVSMSNSEAADSQEICFIDRNSDYKAFLRERGCSTPEGDFTDSNGKVLGSHRGISEYTVGQRKGLGIALGKPAFVTEIDSETNRVVLGDNEDLFRTKVISSSNIMTCNIENEIRVKAKIRYAAKPADAVVRSGSENTLITEFDSPQRAATPGQSIVFYRDDLVIGGGFIEGTM